MVFFESSHRLERSLQDLAEIFGETRKVFLAREMTKLFEQSYYGTLAELRVWLNQDANRHKGEFVIVLAGAEPQSDEAIKIHKAEEVLRLLLEELPLKQAVKIAAKMTGLSKNKLYEQALSLQ